MGLGLRVDVAGGLAAGETGIVLQGQGGCRLEVVDFWFEKAKSKRHPSDTAMNPWMSH
jgi:hypothetical protein